MSDQAAPSERRVLRLYITGSTPRSLRAIENLRDLLELELKGLFELRVIDIYLNPEAAAEHQIVATPTLVKLLPEPVRKIIGDLSDTQRVLRGLGLDPRPPDLPAQT